MTNMNLFVIDQEPLHSYIRYKNMLLYRKGIDATNTFQMDDNTNVTMCKCCLTALKKNEIPKYTAANKMWIGDVPKELTDLTITELRLIGIYRHNSCVIKLKSMKCEGSAVQSGLKGNVITFPQNLSMMVRMLPLTISQLCDEMKIVFIGLEVNTVKQIII